MQRLYYSISDVAKLLDEETYVLRYWEKEFPQISPKKNRSGKRIYSERDVDIIKIVKKLLRDDKLSIIGAKEQIVKFNLINHEDNLFDNIDITATQSDMKPFDNENIIASLTLIKMKLENLLKNINQL